MTQTKRPIFIATNEATNLPVINVGFIFKYLKIFDEIRDVFLKAAKVPSCVVHNDTLS